MTYLSKEQLAIAIEQTKQDNKESTERYLQKQKTCPHQYRYDGPGVGMNGEHFKCVLCKHVEHVPEGTHRMSKPEGFFSKFLYPKR